MNCPRCGFQIRGRARYCPRCGYSLTMAKKPRSCPNCGVQVAEAAVTCFNCGADLTAKGRFFSGFSVPVAIPTAPFLAAVLVLILGGLAWAAKPWQVIQVAVYQTPTPTFTFTPSPSPTGTPTPTHTPTLTPTPEPPYILHRVRLGENLTEIANRYGVTIEAVMALNGLASPDGIQYGTDLKIPLESGEGESSPTATPQATPATGGPTTYVVESGDTLSEIAAIFGVTVEAIMEANGLTRPEVLQVGQTLIIPIGSQAMPTTIPTLTLETFLTPSPTVTFSYTAPVLLSPTDGQVYRGAAASLPLLLNWTSVGLLADDEWYLVSIYYGEDPQSPPIFTQPTKLTSFRVPLELRPPLEAPSHTFRWEVAVVREVPQPPPQVIPETTATPSPTPVFQLPGFPTLEMTPVPEMDLISPKSEMRIFYWY